MDCKAFRELLDLYADNQLSPEALAAASVHLSECPSCRRVNEELLRLRQAVKTAVVQHPVPPALVANVHNISQPPWRKVLFNLRQHAANIFGGDSNAELHTGASDRTQRNVPFWRRRIALPLPAFALLLITVVALGIWITSLRRNSPAQAEIQPTKVPAVPAPSPESVGGMDLTRFDRGERAAVYKVERAGRGGAEQ